MTWIKKSDAVTLPIQQRWISGLFIQEIEAVLLIQFREGTWSPQTFLFDTGSQFTTISLAMTARLGVDVPRDRPVRIRGSAGLGNGFLAPFCFSLFGLEHLMFRGVGCCSEFDLPRPLLSLTDVWRHLTIQTQEPGRLFPLGSVTLRLRNHHQGQPRVET